MRKLISILLLTTLLSSVFAEDKKSTETYDATQIVTMMKFGWNLGNTLDALGGSWKKGLNTQTAWGQPLTTKEMIDGLAKSGVKTIRIPVSWSEHVIDKYYTIDPKWMARVKEIVTWAYENDMFIILNSHHDNFDQNKKIPAGKGVYYPSEENYEESKKFLTCLWKQISSHFIEFDYHLIFETLNEPRPRGTSNEWWYDQNSPVCKKYMGTLNKLNQDIVNTIRASGGNNTHRVIMVPSLAASPDAALSKDFRIPTDTVENRLAISVHMYTPYNFAMASPGDIKFTEAHQKELSTIFRKLYNKFVSAGTPVVIGEMGATNKNNLQDRINWFNFFITEARKNSIYTCCLWDNGVWEINENDHKDKIYSEHYGYYNRTKQTWYFPELIKTAIKAMEK